MNYQLKKIDFQDMEKIRIARNAQMDVLRQSHELTEEEQSAYFEKVIKPSFSKSHPELILYSFFKDEEWIGYGGLVHINWEHKRAEVSFLVSLERAKDPNIYQEDFSHFLKLLSDIAFHQLKLHRLYTETFDFRHLHIKILERFGFKPEGILREHIWFNHLYHDSLMHGLLEKEYYR